MALDDSVMAERRRAFCLCCLGLLWNRLRIQTCHGVHGLLPAVAFTVAPLVGGVRCGRSMSCLAVRGGYGTVSSHFLFADLCPFSRRLLHHFSAKSSENRRIACEKKKRGESQVISNP